MITGAFPTCTLVACNAGCADCDGNAANGCEVDTQDDPANCGGCGVQCSGGAACVRARARLARATAAGATPGNLAGALQAAIPDQM